MLTASTEIVLGMPTFAGSLSPKIAVYVRESVSKQLPVKALVSKPAGTVQEVVGTGGPGSSLALRLAALA